MKTSIRLPILLTILATTRAFGISSQATDTVILDQTGVENLRIQSVVVSQHTFESTVYSLGHLKEIPANRSVLASRVAGRIVELNAFKGDTVEKGEVLAVVESRQPGNPPPLIELKAPRSGVVANSHVSPGQPVEPENELMDIVDQTMLWAVAHVPEDDVPEIRVGAKARLSIPALGDLPLDVQLVKYDTAANHDNGTLDAIFEVPNLDGRLRPGLRAEFHIITSRREKVTAIPPLATPGPLTTPVAFEKDAQPPNAFVNPPLVRGQKHDSLTEILKGLFIGDEVITRGSYALANAAPGSGISLKAALDAAHGHEHNEDGSEMTPDQKAARETTANGGGNKDNGNSGFLVPLLVAGGFGLLAMLQLFWNRVNAKKEDEEDL